MSLEATFQVRQASWGGTDPNFYEDLKLVKVYGDFLNQGTVELHLRTPPKTFALGQLVKVTFEGMNNE